MRGHDGSAAGTGTAALPRGHEHHVGALEHLFDLVAMILGGFPANVRVGAGAETAGQFPADVEFHVGVTHQQGLGVGIDGDELDTAQTHLDHPVDGVDPAASDSDDLDDGQVVVRRRHRRNLFL